MLEFANRNIIENESSAQAAQQVDLNKKRKVEKSHLVWGRPYFGIYERYGSNDCWITAGPGNDAGTACVGQYFKTDEPIKVRRSG